LRDCVPNIPEHLELLFNKSNTILIKTSPLFDLQAGIEELKHVQGIHIVAVKNEVKELVWLLSKETSPKIKIRSLNFTKTGLEEFNGFFNQPTAAVADYSLAKNFLFEPNAAIMKSGLFVELSVETGTSKLHPNSHLYTSIENKNFPGRKFIIKEVEAYKPGYLKKRFKGSKANITTRNFPENVVQLRKKLKIKEGGKTYLFFTTNLKNEKILLICEKIHSQIDFIIM